MTSISRKIQIGDTDISSYVEWGPRRAKGAGRRVKTSPIIGGNRAVVWQEGRDPLTLEAGLIFRPDLADQIGDEDEITALIDDLAGDQETDRLYFGRSDRFAVVHGSVGDTEIEPAAGGAGIIRKTAKFWAEAAELYAVAPTFGYAPLLSEAGQALLAEYGEEMLFPSPTYIQNDGTLDAFLFSLSVVGGADVTITIGDASVLVAPSLMSDEELTMDRFGQPYQLYEDMFDDGDKFAADKSSSSNASVSDGELEITTSGYAIYDLPGVFPIRKGGLLLTIRPTLTGEGIASIDVSTDGEASWQTVIDSQSPRWTTGREMMIYVPQAEGMVNAYIRIAADGDLTSISIPSLKIEQWRHIAISEIPIVPAGESAELSIAGTDEYVIEWRDRYRP
jgi:hypothetical protein